MNHPKATVNGKENKERERSMKEIARKEKIEVTKRVYVAFDGTEFDRSEDCVRYERTMVMNDLSEIEINAKGYPNLNNEGYSYDTDYLWYRPKNKAELELLNKMYLHEDRNPLDDSLIGKWICAEIDYDGNCSYWSILDDGIRYAKDFFSAFGYDMELKEKGKEG